MKLMSHGGTKSSLMSILAIVLNDVLRKLMSSVFLLKLRNGIPVRKGNCLQCVEVYLLKQKKVNIVQELR
jgi:hypothetical protein